MTKCWPQTSLWYLINISALGTTVAVISFSKSWVVVMQQQRKCERSSRWKHHVDVFEIWEVEWIPFGWLDKLEVERLTIKTWKKFSSRSRENNAARLEARGLALRSCRHGENANANRSRGNHDYSGHLLAASRVTNASGIVFKCSSANDGPSFRSYLSYVALRRQRLHCSSILCILGKSLAFAPKCIKDGQKSKARSVFAHLPCCISN